jgi:hypothetical protein
LTHPLQEEEKEEDGGDDDDDEGTTFGSIFASKPWKKCNGYGEMGQEELSFFDPILSRKKKEPHLAAFLQARDGRCAMGVEEWDPSFAGRRRRNHIWQHFASKGWKKCDGCRQRRRRRERRWVFGCFAYLTETTPIFQSFFTHTDADHEDERGDETGSGVGRDGSESQSSSQEEVEIGNASELLEQSLGEEGEHIVLGSGDVVVPVLVRLHCMSLCLVAEHHSRESFAAKKLLLIAAPQRLRPLETSPKCIELAEPHPHLLPASSSCHHLNSPTSARLQSLLPEQKRSLLQHSVFFFWGGAAAGGSWVFVNLLPLQIWVSSTTAVHHLFYRSSPMLLQQQQQQQQLLMKTGIYYFYYYYYCTITLMMLLMMPQQNRNFCNKREEHLKATTTKTPATGSAAAETTAACAGAGGTN